MFSYATDEAWGKLCPLYEEGSNPADVAAKKKNKRVMVLKWDLSL